MMVWKAYATVSVSDLDTAVEYFRDVIGMDVVDERVLDGPGLGQLYDLDGASVRRVVLRLPVGSDLHLEQHLAHDGQPVASGLRQWDFGFIHLDLAGHGLADSWDMLRSRGIVRHCDLEVNNRREVTRYSYSFAGPDGLRLETHEWEDPTAHSWAPDAAPDQPFYAFLHTALSIADQASTLHLYQDLLGLEIDRESEIQGAHLDRMDSCFGGVVKNCVVRGERGSEVQFLWHHAGTHHRQGRPVGRTMRQCDHGIVNIGFETDDLEGLRERLDRARVLIVSDIVDDGVGASAFSFRDPDGNLLLAHSVTSSPRG